MSVRAATIVLLCTVATALVTAQGRNGGSRGTEASPKRSVASEQIGVALGGLNTETDEHVEWSQRPLRVGDEVCIKVIETDIVDTPRHRQRRNRTQELRQQKTYVRQMAKTFGWKILVPR